MMVYTSLFVTLVCGALLAQNSDPDFMSSTSCTCRLGWQQSISKHAARVDDATDGRSLLLVESWPEYGCSLFHAGCITTFCCYAAAASPSHDLMQKAWRAFTHCVHRPAYS